MGPGAQCIGDNRKAENKEDGFPSKVSCAQHKDDGAEQSRANKKREEALFPAIKNKRQFAEQKSAQRPGSGDRE